MNNFLDVPIPTFFSTACAFLAVFFISIITFLIDFFSERKANQLLISPKKDLLKSSKKKGGE
ncbi:MAG: hypothetical protein JRI44_06045 [Deltaproteobacteria bacterium]|nr:hypothetical protein [Deltaproteobacteria bacterium]